MGKGGFPEDSPLALGMLGMHGTRYANMAIHESDLILAMGARFDDRVAGDVDKFAPHATVVHIDIDPAEIGKRMPVHIPIVGDLKNILMLLNERLKAREGKPWVDHLQALKEQYPLTYQKDGTLKPQYILECLEELMRGDLILTTDVGQHQMWSAQYFKCRRPRTFISSGGLGTMGFGLPAAVGAQVGQPDRNVVVVAGDGSLQMNIQELATVRMYDLPVKIFLFNNGCLGMVRQWQQIFYQGRYSSTCFDFNPDFVKVAEAYGIEGLRVSKPEEVVPTLKKVMGTREPFLVDFRVAPEENVMPMVPAGKGICEFLETEGN
jgi:acetolactate synthase-1/2/3 large subunit